MAGLWEGHRLALQREASHLGVKCPKLKTLANHWKTLRSD